MKELDDIDALFQTTFEGFESQPDPLVKANIDRAIASKKKRRRFLFIWFPVLFGTAVLAGTLYFSLSKTQTPGNQTGPRDASSAQLALSSDNEPQEQQTNDAPLTNSSEETPSIHYLHSEEKTSGRNIALLRPDLSDLSKSTSRASAYHSYKKDWTKGRRNNAILRQNQSRINPATSIDQENPESQKPEILPRSLAVTADFLPVKTAANTVENTPDSLTATTSNDSTTTTILAAAIAESGPLPEVTKVHRNWSVSIIAGWENEPKRPAERFDSLDVSLISKEFARIQSTSFYGKVEFNRRINARMDAIIGLGFHAAKITQHGSVHRLDSFPTIEGVGSAIPGSYTYFVRQQNGARIYQVNSILLPLGIAYSAPLGESFRLRISGGTQLAYSWMNEKQSATQLTKPEFRPFGLNAWLRPEIHYNFGNFQVFGFGSFNQPLVQQLKWNIDVKRNPVFGAGIGVLITL